jgi:hemolysin III
MIERLRERTEQEEKWNAITHSIALGVTLLGVLATDSWAGRLLCLALTITFIFSALYHISIEPVIKERFRMLDMAAIHMTIGVTGSAWCWLVGSDFWWVPLIPSFLSFIYTVTRYGTPWLEKYMIPLCLSSSVVCIITFCLADPTGYQMLLFLSGIAIYFGGMFFYIQDQHEWYHTIWHVFVIAASLVHIWIFL